MKYCMLAIQIPDKCGIWIHTSLNSDFWLELKGPKVK